MWDVREGLSGREKASASETVKSYIGGQRLCRGVFTLLYLIIFVQKLEQNSKTHSVLVRAIPSDPYNRECTGIYGNVSERIARRSYTVLAAKFVALSTGLEWECGRSEMHHQMHSQF
jgi:hypothetical protein